MSTDRAEGECYLGGRCVLFSPRACGLPVPPLSLRQSQTGSSSRPAAPRPPHPPGAPRKAWVLWANSQASPLQPGPATTFQQDPVKQGSQLLHFKIRTEHRILEILEGSPCVSQGVKPRLRDGRGDAQLWRPVSSRAQCHLLSWPRVLEQWFLCFPCDTIALLYRADEILDMNVPGQTEVDSTSSVGHVGLQVPGVSLGPLQGWLWGRGGTREGGQVVA